MSPYFPILANSFSPSHSLSASDYQPTSLTKTPPRPPPGYSPTSDYSLYSSPTQESSPHHLPDPLTLQSCTVTSPPDYHPTWIPRAPTPPEYSPTSPTYNVFSPPEYVPACPSESHSSSASVPISPPAYHPSWIPKRIVDISEFSQHSSTSSTQSQWEEYVPTRPSHSQKSLPFRHSYPPPYHPTNIPSVATLECSAPYPAYHPYSSYYPHSSKLEEPSLNCRPHSPCYRPTSPNLNPPVYSSRSTSPSILPYVPSAGSYIPSGSSSSHAPNPSAMSPTHSLAKSEDASTSLSYNHPQSEDASTSLSYNPSSLSYTLTAPNHNEKYSPLSPGYSIP
ncbi:uncharacterized protein [Panulirus ornatus]|uniref:uncharacterized protein n=1 Tax=Panulirus ornatus TaxID=150431 RepID=UPI003A86D138